MKKKCYTKELLYTIDDGYTAIIKVWEIYFHGKHSICSTIHKRK